MCGKGNAAIRWRFEWHQKGLLYQLWGLLWHISPDISHLLDLMELEAKVKLLERQKATLEDQVERSDKKAIIFDMMIDIAEKEYNISIRKNSSPEQSISIEKNIKKA